MTEGDSREARYGRQSIAKCSSLDEQAHGKTDIFPGSHNLLLVITNVHTPRLDLLGSSTSFPIRNMVNDQLVEQHELRMLQSRMSLWRQSQVLMSSSLCIHRLDK